MVGARFLDDPALAPDGVDASGGVANPYPLLDKKGLVPAVPLSFVFSENVVELSVLIGVAEDIEAEDAGWVGWLGVGPSLLAYEDPDTLDGDLAGAVQLGVAYIFPDPTLIKRDLPQGCGIVVQRTFASDFSFASGTHDVDGWHVYLWLALFPY